MQDRRVSQAAKGGPGQEYMTASLLESLGPGREYMK